MKHILTLLFSLTLWAPAVTQAGEFATQFKAKYLPKKLAAVEPGKTSKKEILKSFGKPLKTENNGSLLFFKTGDIPYDTTIEIKNDRVQSFYFRLPEGKVSLKDIEAQLPEAIAKDESEEGHGEGTETQIEHDGIRLAVKNTKAAPVTSFYQSATP
ncbi:hypothetical protein EZJ49_15825 [Bdellovibrio bacteriovorus]|uniref:hypothetical protein n=1 Tax=Bdellovibrio bacteriovorus TaxID=959 RepID=UPI0021D0AB67|nr:hypothetical protein [Bdellovibrio bacteriovorus]UXR64538.1 hypothetical protein EZJ49_15825 [Bdellovibrio bacteriovorus]